MKLLKNDGTPISLNTTPIFDTSKLWQKTRLAPFINSFWLPSLNGCVWRIWEGPKPRKIWPNGPDFHNINGKQDIFACQSNPGLSCNPSYYGVLHIFLKCCCTLTLTHVKQLSKNRPSNCNRTSRDVSTPLKQHEKNHHRHPVWCQICHVDF